MVIASGCRVHVGMGGLMRMDVDMALTAVAVPVGMGPVAPGAPQPHAMYTRPNDTSAQAARSPLPPSTHSSACNCVRWHRCRQNRG